MKRLAFVAMFLAASLGEMLAGAAAQIEHERQLHTPDYWTQLAAEERALGFHAHADEIVYGDTDAGMWEDGGE